MHGGGAALTWEDVAIPVTIPGRGREEASVVAFGHHHVGDGNIAVFDVAIVQLADGLHQLGDLIALDLQSRSSYVSALPSKPVPCQACSLPCCSHIGVPVKTVHRTHVGKLVMNLHLWVLAL